MNENLNLVEILKDCPKGTKLYSSVLGDVELEEVKDDTNYPIIVKLNEEQFGEELFETLSSDGRLIVCCKGECVLFPSKEQRDWSKFNPKKERFDPKILSNLDKVLVRNSHNSIWHCDAFLNIRTKDYVYKYNCVTDYYKYCIPYNEETKHLVGTTEEAPEYYRYWEN